MPRVNHIHIFNREKREREHTVIQWFAGDLLRISNVHEIDITNFSNGSTDVGLIHFNLVDALESCKIMKAIGSFLPLWAGSGGRTLAIVPLNDETGRRIDHIEITDRMMICLKYILPVTTGELLFLDIKFEHP